MAYRIEYASSRRERPDKRPSILRILVLTAGYFVLFCMIICTFWPQGREVFAHFLFPGGARPAMAAAEVFVAELQNGEPIADALEHFCREIIAYAHLP